MKKILTFVLTVILCLGYLSACDSVERSFGAFYSDEYLTENHLGNIPVPGNLSDCVLESGKIFYINMSDEEYTEYVSEVLAYLKGREDIYYLSQPVSFALEAEIAPYDILAPIKDDCKISTGDHTFVFSENEKLGGRDEMRLESEIWVEITRKPYAVWDGFREYGYNTCIVISNAHSGSQWDPCCIEHTYDEGKEYVTPGAEDKVIIYTCQFCGHTEHDEFTGNNKMYAITVSETDDWHHLRNVPDSAPSGVLVQIYSGKLMDADLKVTVNGTQIQCREAGPDQWCYEFIMPCEDVVITAEVDGGM